MHEASMVAAMMNILEEEARRHKVTKITRVRLAVGLFTAVEPRTLEACFELYAEGPSLPWNPPPPKGVASTAARRSP